MKTPMKSPTKSRSKPPTLLQRFSDFHLAVAALTLLTLLIILTLCAPLVEIALNVSAIDVDLYQRLMPPTLTHPLGTDELGRDLLVRLLYGGRISLLVGICGAIIAAIIGSMIGLLSGYLGGPIDTLLMRITDGVIGLPLLPLLIVLAAIDLNKLGLPESIIQSDTISLYRIIVIITLFGWTTVARLVRSATLSVREHDYILAAKASGVGHLRIMTQHILPNVGVPIIIAMTLSVGNLILLESVLSFLGLGIQLPLPSWGNMLSNAQELIWSEPTLAFFPGFLIFVTVICFNFLGDGLKDALDPRADAS